MHAALLHNNGATVTVTATPVYVMTRVFTPTLLKILIFYDCITYFLLTDQLSTLVFKLKFFLFKTVSQNKNARTHTELVTFGTVLSEPG